VQLDEIYNLGAQSHVQVSFEVPEYTADTDGMGTLRLLEAIRILSMEKRNSLKKYGISYTKIFQTEHALSNGILQNLTVRLRSY